MKEEQIKKNMKVKIISRSFVNGHIGTIVDNVPDVVYENRKYYPVLIRWMGDKLMLNFCADEMETYNDPL